MAIGEIPVAVLFFAHVVIRNLSGGRRVFTDECDESTTCPVEGGFSRTTKYNLSGRRRVPTDKIESFISSVNAGTDVDRGWREYVQRRKAEDLNEIIECEHLKPEETEKFIESSFRDGQVRTTGTDIDKILPPMSRFGGGNRQEKKRSVIEKIQSFFERYFGL